MSPTFWQKAANQTLKYALVLLLSVGVLLIMYSLHTSMMIVGVTMQLASNLLWILDVLGTVVLGSIMLFCLAGIDGYLHKGAAVSQTWTRTLTIVKIEALAAVVVLGLELLLKYLLRSA